MRFPWLAAVALTVLPLALGVAAASCVARLSLRARRVSLAAFAAAAVALPLVLTPLWPAPSVYDPLQAGVLAALAAFVVGGFDPVPSAKARAKMALATVAFTGLAGGVEAIATGGYPAPGSPTLLFHPHGRRVACSAFFPEEEGAYGLDRVPGALGLPPRTTKTRRVLHVGDSMVQGLEMPTDGPFVALVGEARPDEEHLNFGLSNTSIDSQLTVLRTWVPRLHPDLVVLYAYAGNDLDEIDEHLDCCDAGPVLRDEEGAPQACPSPVWRFTLRRLLRQGPAPFWLRMVATRSRTFDALRLRFESAVRGDDDRVDDATAWAHYTRALRVTVAELRAASVELRFVVLPRGKTLADVTAPDQVTDRIVATARGLGVRTYDARPALAALLERGPSERWFQRNNPHFSAEGHAAFARWLDEDVLR